jgi:hypothetical protein
MAADRRRRPPAELVVTGDAMKRWLFVALAVLAPTAALGWGQEGHSIIAEVAQREMNDVARTTVDRLLGHGSLASVASWADDIKFSTRPETKPWHFVNIPLGQPRFDPAVDCLDLDKSKGDTCILAALAQLKTGLRCGRDDAAKRDALRFVVHLLGDLTQPLHTVKEGGGGNDLIVTLSFCGRKDTACKHVPTVKFHELWDSTLITETFYDWGAYVERLYAKDGWLNSKEARASDVAGGSLQDWANATHAEAKVIWTDMLAPNSVVDQGYYDDALPILDRQLGLGGLRLARFLNEAYASNTCPAP